MEKHSFVMMIDDDLSILNLISRIMAMEGNCEANSKVREALSLLEETKPNMVIMDIATPEVESPQSLETIKAGQGTPVIMLTTRCEITTLGNALSACTSRYSRKPPVSRETVTGLISRMKEVLPENIPQN